MGVCLMKKQLIRNLRIGDEVETQALILEMYRSSYSSPNRAGNILRMVWGTSGSIKAILWIQPLSREPEQR